MCQTRMCMVREMSRARRCSVSLNFTLITLFLLFLVVFFSLSPLLLLSPPFNSSLFPPLSLSLYPLNPFTRPQPSQRNVTCRELKWYFGVCSYSFDIYPLTRACGGKGGSIVLRPLWKQLSSKSEIGVRVLQRRGKTCPSFFTRQTSTHTVLSS